MIDVVLDAEYVGGREYMMVSCVMMDLILDNNLLIYL